MPTAVKETSSTTDFPPRRLLSGVYMFKAGGRSREEGFTLVELMMVLVVIGILLSLAFASFYFSTQSSREAACKSNLKILRNAINIYYMENEAYPASLLDLIPDYIDGSNGMFCPSSGEDYVYDPVTGEVTCPFHTGL
jgi:prepilin-type N-terminal cleavage/methylation domain-containing protein